MKVSVEIYRNLMVLSAGDVTARITPEDPFSTERLLVGEFGPAEDCLKKGLKKIKATGLLKPKPTLIISPMEMNEGGLSEVEIRTLNELGYACDAKKVILQGYGL